MTNIQHVHTSVNLKTHNSAAAAVFFSNLKEKRHDEHKRLQNRIYDDTIVAAVVGGAVQAEAVSIHSLLLLNGVQAVSDF